MIKKTILICTFALLASVSASARSLVLVLNDSTKIYFLLNDKPVLRMADGKVQIDLDLCPLVSDGELLSSRISTSLKKKKKK